jgi:hypothetical protein
LCLDGFSVVLSWLGGFFCGGFFCGGFFCGGFFYGGFFCGGFMVFSNTLWWLGGFSDVLSWLGGFFCGAAVLPWLVCPGKCAKALPYATCIVMLQNGLCSSHGVHR